MSTSNALEKKQIDIILKLNRLTHDEKIQWTQADNSEGMEDRYYASYRDRQFVLVKPKSHAIYIGRQRFELDKTGFTLYVFKADDEEPLNEIPPIPATKDLVATIQRKLEASQPAQLQSLEELDEELDEWLSESEQA